MIKSFAKSTLALMHTASTGFDKRYMAQKVDYEWPPLFILGVPRSGTTLLYQMMMTAFEFSYIPNISNRWYMCPITAAVLGLKMCRVYKSSFSSTHGYEKGCMAPSEAGNVWNRWFPHEKREGYNYTPVDWLSRSSNEEIYNLIANLEHVFRAPFITKNVKMSVRLAALKKIFPDAVFLVIKRDIKDVILSNLVMRRKRGVEWASVMPKEIEQIRALPELEQVCSQIHFVEKNLTEDMALYPESAVYRLDYTSLCSDPALVIDNVRLFAESNNIHLTPTGAPMPANFELSKPKVDGWISGDELLQIDDILKSLSEVD